MPPCLPALTSQSPERALIDWDDFQFEIEMLLDEGNTRFYQQEVIGCKDKACVLGFTVDY